MNSRIKNLPGQDATILDPMVPEKQMKITIVAFRKHVDFGTGFPTQRFEALLHNYLTKNKFFNEKNNKSKRAKGGSHLSATHTHKIFYEHGARTTVLIRPKVHPDVNFHAIARDFNYALDREEKIVTFWLSQAEFDKMTRDRNYLKLGLRVLHYEIEARWNWRACKDYKLKKTIADYRDCMVRRGI